MSLPKMPPATETTFVKPSVALSKSEVIDLPIPDQFMSRIYAAQILCFPLDPQVNPRQVYSDLCCGLSDALVELPIFAGHMVRYDAVRDRIQIHISVDSAVPFEYSDLASSDIQPPFPDFHRLDQLHFPPNSLDMSLFPAVDIYPTGSQSPALVLKANFIKGGLLLGVHLHHSTSDAVGWTEFFKSWSAHTAAAAKGSRNTPHRSYELLDRSSLFQVRKDVALEDYEGLVMVEDATKTDKSIAKRLNLSSENNTRANIHRISWYFPAERLRALKDAAQSANTVNPWISTSDALCALLWRHTTRARQLKESKYERTMCHLPCSVRGQLSPPLVPAYVGNAIFQAVVSYPIEELYSTAPDCLYRAASAIRKAINRIDDHTIRNFWGIIDSLPTIRSAKLDVNIRPGPDFYVTTLGAYDWYAFDWGLRLGRMARLRWWFPPVPGLAMVQPRFIDGGVEVFMTLETEVLERLRVDKFFTSFAELRCYVPPV